MIVTTNAIVLHSRRFGDTSRIVVLYTTEFGKVSGVAKGARTLKSKLGSALEPLTHCRVTLYYSPNKDLHTVSNAEVVEPFSALQSSYNKLTTAISVCETVLKTQSQAETKHTSFFAAAALFARTYYIERRTCV